MGPCDFTVTLSNDELLYKVHTTDHDDGTYEASYKVSSVGDFNLSVMLNGEHHIYGSPFNVKVRVGGSVDNSHHGYDAFVATR